MSANEAHIAALPAFATLPAQDLAALAATAERTTVAENGLYIKEGEMIDSLTIVVDGALGVRRKVLHRNKDAKRDSPQSVEMEIAKLKPGDYMGLCSLFKPYKSSSNLKAMAPTTVLRLTSLSLRTLITTHPNISLSILTYLSQELEEHHDHPLEWAPLQRSSSAVIKTPINEKKVVFFDAKPYMNAAFLEENERKGYGLEFEFVDNKLSMQTVALAAGARTVCTFVNDQLPAEVLESLKSMGVEMVALRCNGFDSVDIPAADNLGITCARVPNYSPYSVAEHAMALTLCLNRKLHRAYNKVSKADFSLSGLVGFDLHGRTCGVIGTGKIGQCFVDIALGFGMKVLCYDVYESPYLKGKPGVEYTTMDNLFAQSHIISIHVPLLPETNRLINDTTLAKCRQGVLIINTSRGALIDTMALIRGLKSGKVGGAGLDVYEGEKEYFYEDVRETGLRDDTLARLLTFPNVVVTGHQAFLTSDALGQIAETTCKNIKEFMDGKRGKELTNSVNKV